MKKFPCPCCRQLVFSEPTDGDYSICPLCDWEDDPVQSLDQNFSGGANKLSLIQARAMYERDTSKKGSNDKD